MSGGSKLGRYELVARIASGGMGEMFLARTEGATGAAALCVVKRILPQLADDAQFRAMLIAEARIASGMAHPNICQVYALEETNHQLYMAMEYLEGATLLQFLRVAARRRQQLPYGLVAGIVQQACEGLHYAHELRDRSGAPLGVVHRDVSPSNLFITQSGMVKLVDFGIAKARNAAETEAREVKGKYAYTAPEQVRGQPLDRRADVFAFAVVVFEMLTCRRLFQRDTDYLTLRALMEEPLVDLQRYRGDAPDALVAVLERALDRDPAARFSTMRKFGAELLDAIDARPWSQAEISELVRSEFARELGVHSAEVARVLGYSTGRGSLRTIPLVAQPASESDATDYFSIETDYGGEPPPGSSEVSAIGRPSGPGSFALGSAASFEPSRAPAGRRAGAQRRSNLGAMAAIFGGAGVVLGVGLALVEPAASQSVEPRPLAGAGPTVTPKPIAASEPRGPAIRPGDEPHGAAIRGYERDLERCARDHGAGLPPGARAVIIVGGDGHARQIAIEPEAADRSALADCIRGALRGVAFPAAAEGKEVAVRLAREP